jgi:hypothetical protein
MNDIIGYRVWIVYIEEDGRPSLRGLHRTDVVRRWPYCGEGDAHFTMGRMIRGDTDGRSPDGLILCTHNFSTLPGCRSLKPIPDDWTPAPCQVPDCPEDRPRMTNTLGFHAFKTMQALKESIHDVIVAFTDDSIGYVIAEVILWGHIVKHDTGWRGEYSRPHRLHEFVPNRHHKISGLTHEWVINNLEYLYLDTEPMEV